MLLHEAFIKTARRYKKKVAVVDIASGKKYTYHQLMLASMLLAQRFAKTESRFVGVLVPASTGCIITVLGIMIAGKIPVMLNYSTGAAQNCDYAREKCGFKTVVTSSKLLQAINMEAQPGMLMLEDLLKGVSRYQMVKAALTSMLPGFILSSLYKAKPDDTAVIMFTSGSEHEPKAVQLSHSNIMHNLDNFPKIADIGPTDVFIANLPFFHAFGLTVTMWLPLTCGASVVAHANPLDYQAICKSIKDYKVSVIVATPTFYWGYLRKSNPGDFASLKLVVSGADKLSQHMREAYLKQHNVEVMEGYGTTETSPVVATNVPGISRVGSVGKPLPGVRVKVLDIDTDKEQPPGKTGKIFIKGQLVMKGYYDDVEQTSLHMHNGWYDTGDIGYLDADGYLFIKGRLRRFVKIGGEMVSLVQVENELDGLLPDDVRCCVVDIPDPVKGALLVAVLTTEDINQKQIQKKLAANLPSIAIPKRFFVVPELPVMPSGKVNFRLVEKMVRQQLGN